MNKGFTLPEIMISMAILVGSVLSIGQLYIERKKSEVQIRSFTQIQSISQTVISQYYADPSDFPVSTPTMIYIACLTSDGRILKDYQTYDNSAGTNPPKGAIANGPCVAYPDGFEAHLISPAPNTKPSFTVQIFPVSAVAVQDRNQQLHSSQFELPFDLSLSTAFPFTPRP